MNINRPQVIKDLSSLRRQIQRYRDDGHSVGFVPTMGALHAGHMALIESAKNECDVVVVSIYVNPMQFAANEDLDSYPDMIEKDTALLSDAEVDMLYIPTSDMMYPSGFSTAVTVSGVSSGLCGDARPHHFQGVATVVTKLFNQVQPDTVFFGEKDYQQLCVIKQLVKDLDMPIEVVAVPTVREPDGLAMSSRNQYLGAEDRVVASKLYEILQLTAGSLRADEEIAISLADATARLVKAGFDEVEYIELRHPQTLQPLTSLINGARLLSAVRISGTRLIDNIAVM